MMRVFITGVPMSCTIVVLSTDAGCHGCSAKPHINNLLEIRCMLSKLQADLCMLSIAIL